MVGTAAADLYLIGKGLKKLFGKKDPKENKNIDILVATKTSRLIKDTITNPEWLAKQTLVTSPVSMDEIGPRFCFHGRIPSDIPKAVEQYVTSYAQWKLQFMRQYSAYNAKVSRIWHDSIRQAEQSGFEIARQYCFKMLKNIKKPDTFFNPPLNTFLGDPRIVHDHIETAYDRGQTFPDIPPPTMDFVLALGRSKLARLMREMSTIIPFAANFTLSIAGLAVMVYGMHFFAESLPITWALTQGIAIATAPAMFATVLIYVKSAREQGAGING